MRVLLTVIGVAMTITAFAAASALHTPSRAQSNLPYRLYAGQLARDQGLATPTAVPTLAPAPSPTAGAQPSAGSRANPVPLGTLVALEGGWSLKVISVTPNATSQVLAQNQFNDPPRPGHQYFIARVSAAFAGSGSDRFDGSFRLRALGTSSVTRTPFENSCGVIPDKLPDPEVFAGGVTTGNICWEIPIGDASSMVLYDKPFLGEFGTTFLSMIPAGQPVPPPPAAGPQAPLPQSGASRNDPVPKGVEVPFAGGWNVKVISVTPNATAAVLAENQFNDPPATGKQFFIARLSATYVGEGHARFDGTYRIRAVGNSGVILTTFSNGCGVIPDKLPDPDVFPSGTVTGNLCWEVSASDASSLVAVDRPFLMDPSPFYVSMQP
jgi:hypothetical protein